MKLFVIHYHLNPGGVTKVIQSQIKSLKKINSSFNISILTGHCDSKKYYQSLGCNVFVNNELNYLDKNQNFENTLESIVNYLKQQIKKQDTVHIHNPNLGKNPLVTLAIYQLAQQGFRIVNHAHNFAEDRPGNWDLIQNIIAGDFGKDVASVLYPNLESYNFCVLTSVDKLRLENYGVPSHQINLLPNPIDPPKPLDGELAHIRSDICRQLNLDPKKKIVTYPVRVIQRKNIGEFILFAVLFSTEAHWLVTQPPLNPVERTAYEKWKIFCADHVRNVHFQVSQKVDFESLMYASDFCITTSVREGFGMVYLEPWLYNTPVVGRNITEVTRDFISNNINFPRLYQSFFVPYKKTTVDFKILNSIDQKFIIKKAINNHIFQKNIWELNPFLKTLLNPLSNDIVARNKKIILNTYSIENYGHELARIYKTIT